MQLTRHQTTQGHAWAIDGLALPKSFHLADLLQQPHSAVLPKGGEPLHAPIAAPCDPDHEVWAAGVTYLRSRQEREAESTSADVYSRVYNADRPELFFKTTGWRTVGHNQPIRTRKDSDWDVPEPELTLVVNRFGEIVGYTAGNDVSSRSIEGENPLYLPQAKSYDGCCALGPAIVLIRPEALSNIQILLTITRGGETIFEGETNTSAMRRSMQELVYYLFRETTFPNGVLLMTGTGIVPPHPFTLQPEDRIQIEVGELTLVNTVAGNH